jgi:hypothetical protein
MKKKASLSFRMDERIAAAIQKAAADDRRSVSLWVTIALERVLQERGYLPKPKGGEW